MTAIELIGVVEEAGGRFMVDGDRLGIIPKDAAAPVLEELRRHKQGIIDLLSRRPKMPAGVRLIRWEPKEPPIRLSECSKVETDVPKFVASTLAQLDNRLRGGTWHAGNWPLSTLLDRLAAFGCVVALDDPRKAMQ